MIKTIKITNKKGDHILLELTNPYKTGLNVKKITGLGPVKADINIAKLAIADGGIYSSSRANTRNIVFTLGLMPQPVSVQESRRLTYLYFPLKEKIKMEFWTEDKTYYTEGYVESNEPSIFSKDEETDISVMCPYPWFKQVNIDDTANRDYVNVDFFGIIAGFEFPFSNESLEKPLLEFGTINSQNYKNVMYIGENRVGCIIEMIFSGPVERPVIFNNSTSSIMVFDDKRLRAQTGNGFLPGDKLFINTEIGSKKIILDRGGRSINALNILGQGSRWLTIDHGINRLGYDATSGKENVSFNLKYSILYQGI